MDIEVDQRCLGEIDIKELKQRILSQEPEAWAEQAIRQQTYEVHEDTESILMLFCDASWPDGEIYRESGWERLSDVAMPVIDHVINAYYEPGGILLRAMAARLKAHGRIDAHRARFTWGIAFTYRSPPVPEYAIPFQASHTPSRLAMFMRSTTRKDTAL